MSTRSGIALFHKDGKVTSVYCHNDGYIMNPFGGRGVGCDIHDCGPDNVQELKKFLKDGDRSTYEEPYGEIQDRGDGYKAASEWNSVEQFWEGVWKEYYPDYVYFFKEEDSTWYVTSYSRKYDNTPLHDAYQKEVYGEDEEEYDYHDDEDEEG